MRISDWSSDGCSSDLFICFGRKPEKRQFFAVNLRRILWKGKRNTAEISTQWNWLVRLVLASSCAFMQDPPGVRATLIPGCWRMRSSHRVCLFPNSAIPGTPYLAKRRRSEEHTSELQSLMRISYAVFCLKKKKQHRAHTEV